MCFRLKMHTFRCVYALRPRYTNTLFLSRTHRFESVLESGSNRKRTDIVLVLTVENGRKRIKMKVPRISQARVFVVCAY